MPSFEKKLMFQEIVKEFEKSPYAFISNLNGISVLDISEARRSLEKVSGRSLMVKHAMARKIFAQFNVAGAEKYLSGSVVITFGNREPQEISKKLVDFSKTNENGNVPA
jgi:ribosomal protein L10